MTASIRDVISVSCILASAVATFSLPDDTTFPFIKVVSLTGFIYICSSTLSDKNERLTVEEEVL